MADLFCNLLYFRSLTINYSLPLFLPPKQYFSSALHSHNSRFSRTKRRSPHLPLLFKPSPFAASASDIDVISIHEHSDGSLLFRFGDPSEVAKNVEMEEAKTVKEEIEREDTNESSMVKVMEGEDEIEVPEASDRVDSVASSSNTLIAVEGESEFSEKSLAAIVDTELPVLTPNKEIGGISSPDLDIEQIENVEDLNEVYKDLSSVEASILDESSQIENTTVGVYYEESLEKTSNATFISKELEITSIHGVDVVGQQTMNVEECPKQEDVEEIPSKEDVDSPAEASILDQSSEVVDDITTVALLEKESEDISSADIAADQMEKVEEGLDGAYEDSSVDASVLDKSSEVVNGISALVLLETESNDNNPTVDIEIEPTGNVEEGINEEYGDFPVDITSAPDTTTAALSEKETADSTSAPDNDLECTGNVEQVLDEILEEPNSVDASRPDERPEVENYITAHEVSEKETAGITSAPDNDIEYTVNGERGLDEILEEPSSVDASGPDERPGVENFISAQEYLEKEAADATTLVALKTDPVVSVLDTDAGQGGLETAITTNVVPISELQKEETAIHDETIGDDRESFDDDLVSPSSESEPAMSLYNRAEVPNLQGEMQNLATEESSETDMNDIKAVEMQNLATEESRETDMNDIKAVEMQSLAMEESSETDMNDIKAFEMQNLATEESCETDMNGIRAVEMQNVLSNDNKSDMYGAEDDSPTMESAMTWSIGSEEQISGSGSGMPNETVGYVSEKDAIHLLTVSPQLEAASLVEEETITETVEELSEDDGSEEQTVGGDLVEASVPEVTASKSTESTIASQEILVTDFVLSSGAALLPHPSKVLAGGEDAYFIADQTWFGVADGVSQWSLEGTIPGVYAQELIKNCEKLVSDCNGNSINNPLELLNLSIAQTHSLGSSTVLIAQFDGQALHMANIGDSGFIILRHGAVYKRSSPMHHVFSLPVRIQRGDDPSSLAQLYRVDLEEEDIIVTATDGLLDNLYNKEILLIAMKSLADHKSPKEIAEVLAKKAQEVGSSSSARSPFADEAQAAGFPAYSGGKLDDVIVIVSVVQRR